MQPFACGGALTLSCCTLLGMLVLGSMLHLAVAAQCAQGQLDSSFGSDGWQQLCVADGAMSAVGGENGRANVSADLCSAE